MSKSFASLVEFIAKPLPSITTLFLIGIPFFNLVSEVEL